MFNGLEKLTFLNLACNAIAVLPNNTFSALTSLKSLYLSDNALKELPNGVFKNLNNLQSLSLDSNKLSSVHRNDFSGLQLVELGLSCNNIHDIEPSTFSGLHLELLYLTGNKLNTLEPDSFDGLHDNSLLDLTSNNMVEIKKNGFRNLKGREIRLMCNNLTDIRRDDWGVDDSVESIEIDSPLCSALPCEDYWSGVTKFYPGKFT